MHVPADLLLLAQWKLHLTKAINQGLDLYSLYDMHCSVQYCVVCIAVTCDSSLMIKENLCGGLCLVIYRTWCIHSCNALLLSNVAHRVNILVETFLIAIKKCLLSCLVGKIQNNNSIVARFAGSFCELPWLSCSLSESSFMNINTCSCIESFKQQLSHHSNLHVCAEGSGRWSKFFLHFSSSFSFPPSGCFLSRDLVSTVFQLFLQVIDHGCLPLHG